MKQLNRKLVTQYIEKRISEFHNRCEETLSILDLRELLKHKNPYFFRAKDILTAQDLIKGFLDNYLQTREETFFGSVMQDISVFVCGQVFDGKRIDKDTNEELQKFDLGFQREQTFYLVEIKSSWNWGNSGQIRDLILKIRSAFERLPEYKEYKNCEIVFVNGCCFGKRMHDTMAGGYLKVCGQRYWEFISDNDKLYIDIIEPIGHRAKERSESYKKVYAKVVNKFTSELLQDFCDDGVINWERLTCFISEKYPEKRIRRKK